MSTINVPRLQTFHVTHEIGEMIILPADKHRTFLAIQDTDAQNLHIWIGDNPPADVLMWLSLGGNTERDTFAFPTGVFGPIYVSEGGGGAGDAFLLSNLIENFSTVPLPV